MAAISVLGIQIRNHAMSGIVRVFLLASICTFYNPVWAQQLRLEPDTWQLLSIPGQQNQSINELFADHFDGQVAGTVWSISVFNTQSQSYKTLDGSEQLQPGQGFWMVQISDAVVTVPLPASTQPPLEISAACPSIQGCLRVPLPTGSGTRWSLIGNPFDVPLAFNDLRLQTDSGSCRNGCTVSEASQQGLSGGDFFGYNSAAGTYRRVSDGGSLPPGQGYWFPTVLSAGTGSASLLIPLSGGSTTDSVFAKAAQLGRGMNLGNALEAPYEGLWGITLESYYFDRIADAGFDSVRVPIRWSAHADNTAPYTIDPVFFNRVDWVVAQAARTGLAAVLNIHHYEALMASPADERARYLALWDQIATRYANESDAVFFELLNEPTEQFNERPGLWNSLLAEAVDVIRQTNPNRALIVGPVGWNAIDRLPVLQLPDDDQLIGTVHFYSPFAFTHQGATWVDPVPPVGTVFNPDEPRIGGAFQDWSWDTSWASVGSGTRISYQRQYAGFSLRKMVGGQLTQIRLRSRGPVNVAVACGIDEEFDPVDQILQSSTASQEHVIDLSSCSAATTNIILQNQTPEASSFILEEGEVCTGSRCFAIFETAGDALAAELQIAADWGVDNNLPMYVGEFGAHNVADMTSRAAWTTITQRAIHSMGMTSSYWEFGAVFGAFDLSQDRWFDPLLQALLPR